jgi:HlyD family secretion protein
MSNTVPVPLVRPPSPDQLDRVLRVTPPYAWAALSVLGLLLAGGLAWSVLSKAAVKTVAQGVLLSPGGVADIVAPAAGRLERLLVATGAQVTAGQAVALLEQPELAADLSRQLAEGAKLRDQQARIRAFLQGEAAARQRLAGARQESLRERVAALSALEATMVEMASIQQNLFSRGITTRDRFLAVRQQLQEARTQRTEAENSLVQIGAEAEAERIRAGRELLDVEMRLAAAERDVAWTEAEIARRGTVLAPQDGKLVEQVVNPGELVMAGAPLLRMLPGLTETHNGLVALIYVPPAEGKRVRPGMRVQVIPSTVRVQRDGFIEGEVVEVSPIPATREGILRILKNTALVEQLTREGPPVQATVRLQRDPASPTGFHWSTGMGPAVAIGNGTLAEGRIVVDEIPLIALALPHSEAILRRLGL